MWQVAYPSATAVVKMTGDDRHDLLVFTTGRGQKVNPMCNSIFTGNGLEALSMPRYQYRWLFDALLTKLSQEVLLYRKGLHSFCYIVSLYHAFTLQGLHSHKSSL